MLSLTAHRLAWRPNDTAMLNLIGLAGTVTTADTTAVTILPFLGAGR
jgi:hypothetical protein